MTDQSTDQLTARRFIEAEPAAVFAVLRDPEGHVDIDASGMLQAAEGDEVGAVGDRFTVHMDREAKGDLPMGRYDVEVVIDRYETDREIAWWINGTVKPPIGHTYGYLLEPGEVDGRPGTWVTSVYDWSAVGDDWRPIFPVVGQSELRATLGILDRVVRRRGVTA